MKTNPLMLFIAASLMMMGAVTSCSSDATPENDRQFSEISMTNGEKELASRQREFSFKLMESLAQQNGYNNVVISPMSLNLVLGMCANGSGGSTKEEILSALGADGLAFPTLNSYHRKVLSLNYEKNAPFLSPGSFWLADDHTACQPFLSYMDSVHDGAFFCVPRKDMVSGVNNWVKETTNGKITQLRSDEESEATFALANALVFDGKWEKKFDKKRTTKGMFLRADQRYDDVEYMCCDELIHYEGEGYAVGEFPFTNTNYSLIIVLPDKEKSVEETLPTVSADWENVRASLKKVDCNVKMPKFKVQTCDDMIPLLGKMGINSAFDPATADFSGICQEGGYLQRVVQANYFEIDEEGAKAVSATGAYGGDILAGPPASFIVDRPFLYILMEKRTSSLLFMGIINTIRQ